MLVAGGRRGRVSLLKFPKYYRRHKESAVVRTQSFYSLYVVTGGRCRFLGGTIGKQADVDCVFEALYNEPYKSENSSAVTVSQIRRLND